MRKRSPVKLSSVPKATLSKDVSWECKPRQSECRAQILTALPAAKEEGDSVILTVTSKGFLYSMHSAFCVHGSVRACAYMFARAAAVAWEHPNRECRLPVHLGLGLPNPTYLFSRVSFWSPFSGGGQREHSGSFPAHTPWHFPPGC